MNIKRKICVLLVGDQMAQVDAFVTRPSPRVAPLGHSAVDCMSNATDGLIGCFSSVCGFQTDACTHMAQARTIQSHATPRKAMPSSTTYSHRV